MGGAMIAAHFGWRYSFLVAAALGLVLTLLLMALVREPVRGASEPGAGAALDPEPAPSMRETLVFMRGQRSLRLLVLGSVLASASSSAMMSWIGSLLIRTHGLDLPTVGLLTAVCMGGFGALGTLAFGWGCDRLGARDMRWQFRLMAGAALSITLLGTAVAMLPTVAAVAVALALFAACVAGLNGPTYALSQSLVLPRMRGVSMSVLVVLINLVGVGVGPTVAGILSDLFAARFGAESVRWAMVCVMLASLPAVLLFLRASVTVRADLARVDEAG
jgi:predicted MFS family arabinose efflux permease